MKYTFTNEFPNDFLKKKNAPLISIYQETSRHQTENKKDALVFRTLIKEVESSLSENYGKKEIKPLINLLYTIQKDTMFWNNLYNGIALFATLDDCIIFNLNKSPKTIAIVADSFHIKPLIKYYQLAKNIQVLDVSKDSFKILEGNIYDLSVKKLDDEIPTTQKEILGTDFKEPFFTAGSYGGASSTSTFHGHGGKKDRVDIDLEKFFRQLDSVVYNEISKKSKMPIVLLSPVEYHDFFLNSSNNIYLKDKAIIGSFAELGINEVKLRVKDYFRKDFDANIDRIIKNYHNLRLNGFSTDQLIDIVQATIDGRVQTLLIEENTILPGKIDIEKRQIISKDRKDPKYNDILDELTQLALEKGSTVFILKKEKMPTSFGAAAIYRY